MVSTKRNKMLSVRASEEEIARIKNLAAELMKRHRYLKEADIIRELIGLEDTGLITAEMRKRLLANVERIDHTEVAEKLFDNKPPIKKVDDN